MAIPFRVKKNPPLVFALKLMKRFHAHQPRVFNNTVTLFSGYRRGLDW
jgi:hypothetical protein